MISKHIMDCLLTTLVQRKIKKAKSWVHHECDAYLGINRAYCLLCAEKLFDLSTRSKTFKISIEDHGLKHLEEHNLLPFI